MTHRFLILFGCVALSTAWAGGPGPGTSSGRFLLIDPSARAIGMGQLHAVTDYDLFSLSGNPAGLAKLAGLQAGGSTIRLFGDMSLNWVGVGLPFRSGAYRMAGGLFGALFDGGPLELDDGSSVKAESSYLIGIGFATQVAPEDPWLKTLVVGGAAKILSMQLAGEFTSTPQPALDAGLVYRFPSTQFLVGAYLNHLGTPTRFPGGGSGDPLPATGVLGMGYHIPWSRSFSSFFSLEGGWNWDTTALLRAGQETWVASVLALRAGYQFESTAGSVNAGFGLRLPFITFDYGFFLHGRLGATHRVSAVFQWDAPDALSPGMARVNKSVPRALPDWMLSSSDFLETPEALVVKTAALEKLTADEALSTAKQQAKTTLQQTLLGKISSDLALMTQRWTTPPEHRERFVQHLSGSLTARLKDLMRSSSTRASYQEWIEEAIGQGNTEQYVNAYALMELPLMEYRQMRKSFMKSYIADLPPLEDVPSQQLRQAEFDGLLKHLDMKVGDSLPMEKSPSDKPNWASGNESLAFQELSDQRVWTLKVHTTSPTSAKALALTHLVPVVRLHLAKKLREEVETLFLQALIARADQVAAMDLILEHWPAALEASLSPLTPEEYFERVLRALNGDGAHEETYAHWTCWAIPTTTYRAARDKALATALRVATTSRQDSVERTLMRLRGEFEKP